MTVTRLRTGSTLVETLLFLGILAIMSGTIVSVYISTQESRIRQHSVAELEQGGTVLLEVMTKNIRRAEKILSPANNATGSILTLQMATNSEYPTIYAAVDGVLVNVEKTSTAALLTPSLAISNLTFRNVENTNVTYSFDLTTTIPTVVPRPYTRRFTATVTLYPDDQSEAGGCGTCTAPVCTNGRYIWYHCDNGTCTPSVHSIAC